MDSCLCNNLHLFLNFRSPGKIIGLNVPTFEALSQVGTAQVTIKNIGKLEASYSLTVCIVKEITFFFASTFSYVFLDNRLPSDKSLIAFFNFLRRR